MADTVRATLQLFDPIRGIRSTITKHVSPEDLSKRLSKMAGDILPPFLPAEDRQYPMRDGKMAAAGGLDDRRPLRRRRARR